jgi:hypothetical protein
MTREWTVDGERVRVDPREAQRLMDGLRAAATTQRVVVLPEGATIEWVRLPTWAHRQTDPGARA